MGMMINRRRVCDGSKGLPYDAEIEYLESSGTQYIDTLYSASSDFCHVEGNISFTSFQAVIGQNYNFIIPFGAYRIKCVVNLYVPISSGQSVRIGIEAGGTYGTSISGGEIYLNTPFSFNLTAYSGKLSGSCNGQSYNNVDYSGLLNDRDTLALFCSKHIGSPYAYTKIKCYYFKCYSSNNTLVRDFIPVRVGTTGYMYDKVSKQLFGNAGTGSFILGPDKNSAITITQQQQHEMYG